PMRDGRAGFAEMVAEKLDVLGGHLETRRRARALEVVRKRVRAVETDDGLRLSAEVVVLDGGEPMLAQLWPEATASDVLLGHRCAAHAPVDLRPEGLHDPCGFVPAPGAPAHLVRLHEDQLVISWVGAERPPDVAWLVPFSGCTVGPVEPMPLPGAGTVEPLGLFRRGLEGPLRNQLFVGEWILPGLGLETACVTAWYAAGAAEAQCPRRGRKT
ncbi:MAG: hypothetical protein KC620_23465, partial [Myxococcales bacterium]|nr:hypothetical protein [Myxococcales bacterium]